MFASNILVLVALPFAAFKIRKTISILLQGPVLIDNDDYMITVSIVAIDDMNQPLPPSDNFLLPSANATSNILVPFNGGEDTITTQ